MATGEIELRDIVKAIWKEIRVGLICGTILAIVNFGRLYFMYPESLMISVIVVISMFLAVVLGKVLGVILPMAAKAMKLDPALMAAPLLTTILDSLSMVIYFSLATYLLRV